MEVAYISFSENNIPDNDISYFHLLESLVDSIDQYAYVSISKNPKSYSVRISVSENYYINSLIEEINTLNNLCKLKVEFSKSMKSGNIFFVLTL